MMRAMIEKNKNKRFLELICRVTYRLFTGSIFYSASSYDRNGNLQSTVHAWAIPSDSTSAQETSSAGGCGMIRPVGGTRSGPGQAADLIALLAIILVMACRRGIRRPIYTPIYTHLHTSLLTRPLLIAIITLS